MSGAAPPPAQGAPAGSEAESSGSARDLLLAAASAVMREGDLVDISLSELSLRSGLNSALVKYYFGNKAGLLTALLDRDMAEIVRSVDALVAKDDMLPQDKLRRHISRCIDTYYRYPYLNRLLMRLVRDSDEAEAQRIADKYLRPLSRAYDQLIGEGAQRRVPADRSATVLFHHERRGRPVLFRAAGAAPLLRPGFVDRGTARPLSRTHRRSHHGRHSCTLNPTSPRATHIGASA
jgi:AcrR family transcriptional regulator